MKRFYLAMAMFVVATNWQQTTTQEEEPTTETPATQPPAPAEAKIDTKKLKEILVNVSMVVYNATSKEQQFLKDMAVVFGNRVLELLNSCLGSDWLKKCMSQIAKCPYHPTPKLCLWKLVCSEQKCSSLLDSLKGLYILSTTPTPAPRLDTTLSSGKAMLASAMKAAGIQCDKLYSCLTNMGFSLRKFLKGSNFTLSTHHPGAHTTLKPTKGKAKT